MVDYTNLAVTSHFYVSEISTATFALAKEAVREKPLMLDDFM